MQYLLRPPLRRPAFALALACAALGARADLMGARADLLGASADQMGARADLTGTDRLPSPATPPPPRVGELRWSLVPASDHRLHFGAALRRPGADAAIDPYGRGWQLGLWAEDEWRIGDRLRATGGLRVGRDDAGGRSDVPHAGLAWAGPAGLQLRAGIERGQRGAALGFDRQWDGGLRLQAEVGVREASDQPSAGLAVGVRLASRAWWVDVGSIGTTPAADPRQFRLGANFVF